MSYLLSGAKKELIEKRAKVALGYQLEAEYEIDANSIYLHPIKPGSTYIAAFNLYPMAEKPETGRPFGNNQLTAREIDLFYNPAGHQAQVIFGKSVYVKPEEMPERIDIHVKKRNTPMSEIIEQTRRMMRDAANNLVISIPEGVTGIGYCRIWRINSIWI